jgi:alpha-1,3-glucosyltransferase
VLVLGSCQRVSLLSLLRVRHQLICLHRANLLVRLGITTALSFILLFSPFLPPFAPLRAVLDPITRIFPFARGLFEDKVANFWCASNVIFKWRNFASPAVLIRLSTLLTAAGFLPAVVGMLVTGYKLHAPAAEKKAKDEEVIVPCLQLLPYALLTSAMSFFLFSFQVHEKTILLPLMPLALLLSGAVPYSTVYEWGMLMSNVAMFR